VEDATPAETGMNVLSKESPFYPVTVDQVVLESTHGVAFFDRYPLSKGHVLVVPRFTVNSLYELTPEVQADLWELARQVREILSERFHPDGFNVGLNDGQAAGQTVAHAHIHIIPRYRGDVPDPRGGIRWAGSRYQPAGVIFTMSHESAWFVHSGGMIKSSFAEASEDAVGTAKKPKPFRVIVIGPS